MVGIHLPYYGTRVAWWVYTYLYYAHPPSSRVYHGAHCTHRLQCRCISGSEVHDDEALGSTLGL